MIEKKRVEHQLARGYLAQILLSEMEEKNIPLAIYSAETKISERTFYNMQHGKIPCLFVLCKMFSSSLRNVIPDPDGLCWMFSKVIDESLRKGVRYPELRLKYVDEEKLCHSLPDISEYLKDLRVGRLKMSVRGVSRRFNHCTRRQLYLIEKDCCGVGLIPILNLFDNYQRFTDEIADEEWGTMMTLILRRLFPDMKGCVLEFAGWKSR